MNPKHRKFIAIAQAVATLSKDTSTKVGAIALGPAGEIRAMGYNGMPRGCDDTVLHKTVRPEKYFWFEHAERNLIYNAARIGVSLEGSTLILSGLYPCMDCARAIVQSGIREVITPHIPQDSRWTDHAVRSNQLFNECGILIHEYEEILSTERHFCTRCGKRLSNNFGSIEQDAIHTCTPPELSIF